MRKTIEIANLAELTQYEKLVESAMDQSVCELADINGRSSSAVVFSKMKFGGVGCDPLNPDRQLNLIEQINQSFTYLASFLATEILFDNHLDLAPFRLNLGTASGSDIESCCGSLAAEVFASVTPSNNQKLKKDIDKVAATDAAIKYSFFMSPGYDGGRQASMEREGVRVWALKCPQ